MLDIFEILGPIMVGPSSSHTAGAVRIGRMARTLLGEPPVKADIGLYGSFAETGRGHGTDRALVAGLLGMKPDDLRIPESFSVAKEQGLSFVFHPAELREAHPNTAVLTVEGASGKKTKVQAASIGGGRIRVDQLDGVAVDFTGIFNTLIVRHMDVPGELATLTKVLSDGGINIANMSAHFIEKIPIMRNNNNRVFKIQKEIFKPTNGRQIKVVCWLIKQKNIRITEKCLCKQHLNL